MKSAICRWHTSMSPRTPGSFLRIVPLFSTLLLLLLLSSSSARSQLTLDTRVVTEGLEIPWEILWGPDDWLWVTERPGHVSRIHPETGQKRRILTLPNPFGFAEVGMLGMALHPDFERSPYVYIVDAYQHSDSIVYERVVRYYYDRGKDTLRRDRVLIDSVRAGVSHGGSRIKVGPDSMIYVTFGDKGENPYDALDHTKVLGKTVRVGLEGTVPADNPWPRNIWPASLIWTMGHRNSQGITFAPSGMLYASEHGPEDSDEINIMQKGRSYGWPIVQGMCDNVPNPEEIRYCADSSVVEPIRVFTRSIAPAGLDFYDHHLIDEWRNSILLATLGQHEPVEGRPTLSLVQMKLDPDGTRIVETVPFFSNEFGRLRDLCVAPDGRVFIATSNRDGRFWPSYLKYATDRIIEIRPHVDPVWLSAKFPTDGLVICAGEQLAISFDAGGLFRAGNRWAVQLSDSSGSFARPLEIGSTDPISGRIDTLSAQFALTIPEDLPSGSDYRIRLVSTRPYFVDDSSVTDLMVHAKPRPVIHDSSGVLTTDDHYRSYRWLVDGREIADADEPALRPERSGRYRLKVTDSAGCTGITDFVDVLVSAVPVVSLPEGSVRIYPQPAFDRLTIEIDLKHAGSVEIFMTDVDGARAIDLRRQGRQGEQRFDIPIEALPAGMYIVEIRTADGRWTDKIVKR